MYAESTSKQKKNKIKNEILFFLSFLSFIIINIIKHRHCKYVTIYCKLIANLLLIVY